MFNVENLDGISLSPTLLRNTHIVSASWRGQPATKLAPLPLASGCFPPCIDTEDTLKCSTLTHTLDQGNFSKGDWQCNNLLALLSTSNNEKRSWALPSRRILCFTKMTRSWGWSVTLRHTNEKNSIYWLLPCVSEEHIKNSKAQPSRDFFFLDEICGSILCL